MTLLSQLYQAEQDDGWGIGMRAVTHALLDHQPLPEGPLLEVGCGGGALLAELRCRYPAREVAGIDRHPQALVYARRTQIETGAAPPVAQADLHHLPFDGASFGLLLALDVFDQAGVDLGAALAESRRVLRPDGLLLVRVSAHGWLYGEHDAAFNTGRRYSRAELGQALAAAGFVIRRMTYANALWALPVGGLRLLQRWRLLPFAPSLYRQSAANRALHRALSREAHWIREWDLPVGLSLYALCAICPE